MVNGPSGTFQQLVQTWSISRSDNRANISHSMNRTSCIRESLCGPTRLQSRISIWTTVLTTTTQPTHMSYYNWPSAYEDILLQTKHNLCTESIASVNQHLNTTYCARNASYEQTWLQARRKLWSDLVANDNQCVNAPAHTIVNILPTLVALESQWNMQRRTRP